jgi:hypothetical protein
MANTKITSRVIADNSVGIDALNVTDGTNGQALVTDGSGGLSFASVGVSGIDSSADATAITIDSSENVGIGGSPDTQLNIKNADDAVVRIESIGSESGDDARLELKTTNGTFTIQNDRSLGTSGALTFAGNTSNNIVIDYNDGSVGIGTNNPNDILDIHKANSQLRLTDTDDSKFVQFSYSGGKLIVRNNSTSSNTEQFTLTEDGKFGIGTHIPAVSLDVGSNTDAIDVPSGTTAQRPSSPSNGMIRYNTTLNLLESYANGSWTNVAQAFIASGGTVVSSGGYKYHTFTSSGTFTVTSGTTSVDFLVVAGGGGGGSRHGGGGGAGGYQTGSYTAVAGNYTVTIGAGGVGAVKDTTGAANGGNSSVFGTTSTGGGLGPGYTITTNPGNGGSGGGAANKGSGSFTGGSGTAGQGNDGGDVTSGGANWAAAGGGGATTAGGGSTGGTGVSGGNGGTGSNSVSTWATATSTGDSGYYAGGGGGSGSHGNGSGGSGGSGGGGDGVALNEGNANDGTVNTGGGGGGSRDYNGGAGGSGIVIIRYQE